MFTGIIEETGRIETITRNNIIVKAEHVLQGTKIGDSIAVNGVCLTAVNVGKDSFIADVSPQTFSVTSLNKLKTGSLVNLERAMSANGRFGGHIVSGHIDGVGTVHRIERNSDFYDIEVVLNDSEARYVVGKGSIAIDGISLTVAEIRQNLIKVAVIPHTYENTNLKYAKIGDSVNIETDIISKYVEKFLLTSDNRTGIDMEFLVKNGF